MAIFDPEATEKLDGKKATIIKKLDEKFWLCSSELDGEQVFLLVHLPLVAEETEAAGSKIVLNLAKCDRISLRVFEVFTA